MSRTETSFLFTPLRIGKIELKNRLALMPITTMLDGNDEITDKYVRFFEARAKGGVGILFTGKMSVISTRDATIRWPGIYDEKFIPGMKRLTDAIHSHHVPVIAQVGLGGLINQWRTSYSAPLEAVAPSPTPIFKKTIPRELSVPEIKRIVEQFGEAVALAKEGGFDGVDILACQGSLINRFLSPLTNRRTDEYGGSLDNRMRMLIEIIGIAKKKVGDDFVLSCRLSVDELMEGGLTTPDYLPICVVLEKAGVHCLNVGVGWHESTVPYLQNSVSPGSLTYVAKAVKQVVTIPVITAQRINSAPLAENILARREADIIGMARALIADPDLPNKTKEGRLDEIKPCICCMRCNENPSMGLPIACSVNPQVGREGQDEILLSEKPKGVVIVGGGPAGMEAALIASARGHKVEIIEQRNELGGQLIEGAIPPYKSEMREYIDYQRNQIQRSNILVEMGERSDTNKLKEKNPDVVILATGSRSASRDFPGIGRQNVFTASDILHHPEQCKERVVIIGGGLIGCETAEFLAQHEKKVTIIEMLKRIGSDMGPDTRWVVRKRLTNAGVVLEINTKAVRIEEDGVVAAKDDSRCVFPADTVIIAWGMESNNDLEEPVKKSFPEVCSIGDCTSPQSVLEAVEQGYFAALRV